MASTTEHTGNALLAAPGLAEVLAEDPEGAGGASPAGVALRYLGLLVLTLASAVAISGYAPADLVTAVGL